MAEQKRISGYENYSITDRGEIYSHIRNKWLKTSVSNNGYPIIMLYKNKKPKTLLVHRLVALTFIKKNNITDCVNHKDGNKKNNSIKNLEWVSLSDNIKHAWETGLHKTSEKFMKRSYMLGDKNRVLKFSDAIKIRTLWGTEKYTQVDIAKIYGVDNTTIYKIVNNKTYRKEFSYVA